MNENTCCFFGHRAIEITDNLKVNLCDTIKRLIVQENIDTFLFGSRSQFDDLCYKTVSELKTDYPHIKRVYVRAEYPYINNDYKLFLLESYEGTYYPDSMLNAGRSAYVERNREMISQSKYCIIYYDTNYTPPKQTKSGTKLAYDYALKKNKNIINMFN